MSADAQTYKDLHECSYSVSERDQAIHDRIALYHQQTPDSMDNKQALPFSRSLHRWVHEMGYTPEEFSRAKRNYWQSVSIQREQKR